MSRTTGIPTLRPASMAGIARGKSRQRITSARAPRAVRSIARIQRGLKNAGNIDAALSHRGAHRHGGRRWTMPSGRRSVTGSPRRLRAMRCTAWPASVSAREIFSSDLSQGYSPSQTWHTVSGRTAVEGVALVRRGLLAVVSTVAADGLETALERRARADRVVTHDPAPVPQLERGNAPQRLLKVALVTLVGAHELRNEFVVDTGHHALDQDRRPQAAERTAEPGADWKVKADFAVEDRLVGYAPAVREAPEHDLAHTRHRPGPPR